MKLFKKDDRMVTTSKRKLNLAVIGVQCIAAIEGASVMYCVLDSFMGGAIGDKVADTIDRLQGKRRAHKDHEIVFEGTRKVSNEYMAKIMKAPEFSMHELEKAAGDPSDDQILAEITDLADYTEACRLAGRKIDPEEWEAWKKNANFSMEALRIYYGATE